MLLQLVCTQHLYVGYYEQLHEVLKSCICKQSAGLSPQKIEQNK